MRQLINGADFRRMVISAAASIEIHKQQLNELNVFPVPDGDTGTNMSMTINAASADLRKTEDPSLEQAAKVTASAMLRGARGNSGVILSLLFRGLSKKLKGETDCDGVLWAEALQEGVDAAYKAVMKPAEGTILTVARLAAAKAREAAQENNFIEFVHSAALEEAKIALAATTDMNPVLKKAGVVDAGGKGWVCALEAMLSSLQGNDVIVPEGTATETKEAADFADFDTEDITFTYCTEFIIDRENEKDPEELREHLKNFNVPGGFTCGSSFPHRQTYDCKVPFFVSEYGGIRWTDDQSGWGYGEGPKTEEEFLSRLKALTDVLLDDPRIFGLCYTQLTDVEQEQNGLYTYDRRPKFPPEVIAPIFSRKAAIED